MSRSLITLVRRPGRLFPRSFGVMAETLGVHYHNAAQPDDRLAANLSYLCRENRVSQVAANEVAVPGAALITDTPQGHPLWADLLRQRGQDNPVGARQLSAQSADVCCRVPLPLYLLTGGGLEVHQQNPVQVFDHQGNLQRLIARNFGAFRIYRRRFEQTGYELELHHDRRLIHSLLIGQLGELIKSICERYNCSGTRCGR